MMIDLQIMIRLLRRARMMSRLGAVVTLMMAMPARASGISMGVGGGVR